jgi:ABC-type transport system substrate-binding protein
MGSINAAASDEPKETLDFLLNGDNITDQWSANTAFYSEPEVQRMFRTAAAETDEARRLALYQQIEQRIVDDAPWIFICHGNLEMVRQPWLQGARILPSWPPVRLENAWIDR